MARSFHLSDVPSFHLQVEIEHQHLRDVLAACTTQTDIALRVLRLNTDLNLHVASQMYGKGLEV